jgi:uncharacterized protein YgfB (UPF0149 family)
MSKPSYQSIGHVLVNNDAAISAAEAHGILVGILCVNADSDTEMWLDEVFADAEEALSEGELAAMVELADDTRELLHAVDFSFALFLPDDDAPLAERALALSDWCQGFLYGVGYAGPDRQWSGDCAELLRDLADISQLDANASGESDEAAYAEISEFVRVGVQLVRGDSQSAAPMPSRLH